MGFWSASGSARAQAGCVEIKRYRDSVSAKILKCQQGLAKEQDRRATAEAMAKGAQSEARRAKTEAAQAVHREMKALALHR